MPARNKHSSLLNPFVVYKENSVLNTALVAANVTNKFVTDSKKKQNDRKSLTTFLSSRDKRYQTFYYN